MDVNFNETVERLAEQAYAAYYLEAQLLFDVDAVKWEDLSADERSKWYAVGKFIAILPAVEAR